MLGETLNNIAFGKGNPSLVSKIVKATNAVQHNTEGRLYRLAINRGLLPKSLLKFVDPKTPLLKLPQLIGPMPSESSSEFLSEHYQPFLLNIKIDGEKALARIIESHLRLAVDIAKKYSNENAGTSLIDFMQESSRGFVEAAEDEDLGFPLGDLTRTRSIGLIEATESEDITLPLDDLIQEGAIGLIIAAEKFQPNQGTRYMSYAGSWVYQRILRAMKDQARIIRVPVHMIDRINNLVSVSDELLQELGREPSLEEIGGRMGLSPEQVRDIMMVVQLPVSLYSPLGDDRESSLSDFLEDETFVSPFDTVSSKLLKEQIDKLLTDLKPKEREVIELRFGLKDGHARTLEEVGRQLNVTRERIRQIEGNALKRLRHPTRSRWLKGYLE
jgi:RNA polymerase primary sigma factor